MFEASSERNSGGCHMLSWLYGLYGLSLSMSIWRRSGRSSPVALRPFCFGSAAPPDLPQQIQVSTEEDPAGLGQLPNATDGISWHHDAVTMTGWYCKNDQLDVENAWEKDWNWLGTQANMVKYCQIRSNWSWKHNWNKVKDWQHVFHYVVQGQVMSSSELTLANDLNWQLGDLWVSGHPNNWSQGEAFEFQQIGPQQPVHLHSNSMCTRYDWHVAFWQNGTTVQPFFWVGQNPVSIKT